MLVLGALGSFLGPFCGHVLPKVDKLCSTLTFEIPPEEPSVDRGTSSIRHRLFVGPYSRAMPRTTWWSKGGRRFLMSEVPQ